MSALLSAAIAAVELDGSIASARIHKMNAVPQMPAMPYVELAEPGFLPQAYTLDATHGVRDHEIIVRTWAGSADGAQDYMDLVIHALLDVRLYAGGYEYGPGRLVLRPSITRDPDDGGVIGLIATLNFTATEE